MKENPRIKPIERATNTTWDEWLNFMDGIDAKNLNHHEIATKVLERLMGTIDNPAWWAQSISVAYEQHTGRRVPGQRPDGTFQTSVSKSTKLGMKDLMDAWVDFAAKDQEVLDAITGDLRVSGTDRRITWRTKAVGGSSIIVMSEPKTNNTAALIVQLLGLQTTELNDAAKSKWSAILNRFLGGL
jgi:hypothetical protein